MNENRPLEFRFRLELCQKSIDIVNVFWTFDLRNHDDIELVADLGNGGNDVVETPRRIE